MSPSPQAHGKNTQIYNNVKAAQGAISPFAGTCLIIVPPSAGVCQTNGAKKSEKGKNFSVFCLFAFFSPICIPSTRNFGCFIFFVLFPGTSFPLGKDMKLRRRARIFLARRRNDAMSRMRPNTAASVRGMPENKPLFPAVPCSSFPYPLSAAGAPRGDVLCRPSTSAAAEKFLSRPHISQRSVGFAVYEITDQFSRRILRIRQKRGGRLFGRGDQRNQTVRKTAFGQM